MGSLLQKMIRAWYDAQTIWKKIFVIHTWLKTEYNKCDSFQIVWCPSNPESKESTVFLYFTSSSIN